MRRRLGFVKQTQTRGLITHYFRVRISTPRAVASCPDPSSTTEYSSSSSNSSGYCKASMLNLLLLSFNHGARMPEEAIAFHGFPKPPPGKILYNII
ncbi:hypothetical protein TIFTF001_048710 [Ficus carica]|uniref:Uncharacterized protein n=1 Tax=Ficus carica TaxID=3494 RepID=A0AA87YRR8_FICCA|nr:hypothetical protein TIFTF001_048709 [Ficus carica]GMN20222.1 hypothetical protein TIFTF001_048710 [Ficus carica]